MAPTVERGRGLEAGMEEESVQVEEPKEVGVPRIRRQRPRRNGRRKTSMSR